MLVSTARNLFLITHKFIILVNQIVIAKVATLVALFFEHNSCVLCSVRLQNELSLHSTFAVRGRGHTTISTAAVSVICFRRRASLVKHEYFARRFCECVFVSSVD